MVYHSIRGFITSDGEWIWSAFWWQLILHFPLRYNERQCGSPAAFVGTGCPLVFISLIRSVNLHLGIFLANEVSSTILWSWFRLLIFDLGFAFKFDGLTRFGGFGGGNHMFWTGQGQSAKNANTKSVCWQPSHLSITLNPLVEVIIEPGRWYNIINSGWITLIDVPFLNEGIIIIYKCRNTQLAQKYLWDANSEGGLVLLVQLQALVQFSG